MTYWESLRRNEARHRELLEAWLREHGADPRAGVPARDDLTAAALDPGAAGRRPLGDGSAGAPGRAADAARLRSDHDFEDQAVVIYGRFAYQAEDRELTELFKELARSESGHRNGLRRVLRELADPATPLILFCPLCGWDIDFGPDPCEGTEGKCRMCPGRFALRLDSGGDWALERLAP